MQIMPFGSHANGLSMHTSDIDIVIMNLTEPEDVATGGESLSVRLYNKPPSYSPNSPPRNWASTSHFFIVTFRRCSYNGEC